MFLYGMNRMAEGMQKLTGAFVKNFLEALSDKKAMAILAGVLITAIIQSSTGTTIMVVGFVNAGILSLIQSVGVIMGANIGTTVTGWLVSLFTLRNLQYGYLIASFLVGIAAFMMMFLKTEKKKVAADVIFGAGILFLGLFTMTNAIGQVKEQGDYVQKFLYLGNRPFLAIIAGIFVTLILQSSSVSIGILQCFALNGLVNWKTAVFIILGQNIGTCMPALISSAGTQVNAKRSAMIHLFFNVFGTIVFGFGMAIVFARNAGFANGTISSAGIAAFHSGFNIVVAFLLAPFTKLVASFSDIVLKSHGLEEAEDDVELASRHLDKRILESPSFAVAEAVQEVVHMGEVAYESVKLAFDAIISRDARKVKIVFEKEDTIDKMTDVISDYLVKISALPLTEEQHTSITNLFYTVSNFERMGDHAENLAELCNYMIENNIQFSEPAYKELEGIMEIVTNSFIYSIRARRDLSKESADRARQYEDLVDSIEDELRNKHMKRLANELCKPTSGVVFLDILSNLERISDHADNVAGYVLNEI
ncbi:Na/Pi cotransporter family protein [[Clostridium] polysaccharolyticum]|nr:Na/Pi cotransporter family protein [[Clostridium] polysaccharolyticum]